MNKQELIKEFREVGIYSLNIFGTEIKAIPTEIAITSIEQLDEPEKVKIPQFVAEKIEYFKKSGDWDLFQAMDYMFGKKEIKEWLEDKNNQELFARAWLDGYEVEKEKRYEVILCNGQSLKTVYRQGSDHLDFEMVYGDLESFTRKQLQEANFGWVFDCPGIEIEEVELCH